MKSARLQALSAPAELPAPERDAPWRPGQLLGGTWVRPDGAVDSVQWVDLAGSGELDLGSLEEAYFRWVPRLSADMVRARPSVAERLIIGLEPFGWPSVIRLGPAREEAGSRAREIEGGFLARRAGSIVFELQPYPDGQRLVVAVRGLVHRLPRFIYLRVQAPLHERSTFAFLREMRARIDKVG